MREAISKLIAEQRVKQGHKPVNSFTFTVPKPNGRRRLVHDFSPVNEYLLPHPVQFPQTHHFLSRLSKTDYMMVGDLRNGYWSLKIDKEASKLTGFVFEGQSYYYVYLPQGLSPAPGIFQGVTRRIGDHLQKVTGLKVWVYLDDFLFAGPKNELLSVSYTHLTLPTNGW
jgi:hypothetical protein